MFVFLWVLWDSFDFWGSHARGSRVSAAQLSVDFGYKSDLTEILTFALDKIHLLYHYLSRVILLDKAKNQWPMSAK